MEGKRQHNLAVGIIGCGHWGMNDIRILHFMEDVSVRMAVDASEDSFKKVIKQYPSIQTDVQASKAIEDPQIQAVVVATPAQKEGHPVLIEPAYIG